MNIEIENLKRESEKMRRRMDSYTDWAPGLMLLSA